MVKILWRLCTLSSIVLAISCSSIYGVSYDYSKEVDFTTLRTYDWLPATANDINENRREIDSINLRRIRGAVNNQLEAKGLRVSSTNPDLLIAVYIKTKERLIIISYGGSHLYPYYGYVAYWGTPTIRQYEEGTLLLDFIDAKSSQLIWRGSAKSDLDVVSTPEKREAMINEAVQKILEKFPPPSPNKNRP